MSENKLRNREPRIAGGELAPNASREVLSTVLKSWHDPPKGTVFPKGPFIHCPEVVLLQDCEVSHYGEIRILLHRNYKGLGHPSVLIGMGHKLGVPGRATTKPPPAPLQAEALSGWKSWSPLRDNRRFRGCAHRVANSRANSTFFASK